METLLLIAILLASYSLARADVITVGPGSATITQCAMSFEWDHGAGFNFLLLNTSASEMVDYITFAQWFAPLTLNLAPGHLGSFSVYSLTLRSEDITVNTAPYLRDTSVVYTGTLGLSRPVPEPATLALLGSGLIGLAGYIRGKKNYK